MTRPLTEHERSVVINALHAAKDMYRELHAKPEVIAAGLSGQFEQQAFDADYLAGMLEEVTEITISNEVTA